MDTSDLTSDGGTTRRPKNELHILIDILRDKIKHRDESILKIKYPKLLLVSLNQW